MKHLDLFSGIGGFAYAIDQVWPEAEHIFVENDEFCQKVLRKHYPNSQIHGDIRTFGSDTDTNSNRRFGRNQEINTTERGEQTFNDIERRVDILTGGFPCQPFSQAGRRKGTADNRYLWPEMFRIIQLTKPQWVIAENVRGLVTWNEGMVLEQVCADLESEGYEVQPIIIPAVAVNAPHRRDRVWIVAQNNAIQSNGKSMEGKRKQQNSKTSDRLRRRENTGWHKNWLEVATRLCRVDDGLSAGVDGFSPAQHRVQRLKALGNAIVPQVAIELMRAIKGFK